MDTDNIKAVAALEVNRRRLLQGLGVAAGATALGLSPSDPVYAATTGYDLKHSANGPYVPPDGLAKKSNAKDTALAWIDRNQDRMTGLSDDIWGFAELSLREWQSAASTANFLQRNGFSIEWGTAGLPAAFIATFVQGSGGPILGFNGEYDALPGLSQTQGSVQHDPLIYNYDAYGPAYGPGHGDAHNCLVLQSHLGEVPSGVVVALAGSVLVTPAPF